MPDLANTFTPPPSAPSGGNVLTRAWEAVKGERNWGSVFGGGSDAPVAMIPAPASPYRKDNGISWGAILVGAAALIGAFSDGVGFFGTALLAATAFAFLAPQVSKIFSGLGDMASGLGNMFTRDRAPSPDVAPSLAPSSPGQDVGVSAPPVPAQTAPSEPGIIDYFKNTFAYIGARASDLWERYGPGGAEGQMELAAVRPAPPGTHRDVITLAERINLSAVEKRHNLPTGMLFAVMHAESGGDTKAVSTKGASGAFQFMPPAAERFGVRDRFDPHQSAEGAGKYLEWLMKRYNGNVRHALAGYNWGEGNVDKMLKGEIRHVPKETLNYVAKITGVMPQYAAISEQQLIAAGGGGQQPVTPSAETARKEARAAVQASPPADPIRVAMVTETAFQPLKQSTPQKTADTPQRPAGIPL